MSLLSHGKSILAKRKQEDGLRAAQFKGLNEDAQLRLKSLKAELRGTRGLSAKESSGNVLKIYKGRNEIATVIFGFTEDVQRGYFGGTGRYFPNDRMSLNRSHTDDYGCLRGPTNGFESFSRDHLAVYLAQVYE